MDCSKLGRLQPPQLVSLTGFHPCQLPSRGLSPAQGSLAAVQKRRNIALRKGRSRHGAAARASLQQTAQVGMVTYSEMMCCIADVHAVAGPSLLNTRQSCTAGAALKGAAAGARADAGAGCQLHRVPAGHPSTVGGPHTSCSGALLGTLVPLDSACKVCGTPGNWLSSVRTTRCEKAAGFMHRCWAPASLRHLAQVATCSCASTSSSVLRCAGPCVSTTLWHAANTCHWSLLCGTMCATGKQAGPACACHDARSDNATAASRSRR